MYQASQVSVKDYVDRGVQTNLPYLSSSTRKQITAIAPTSRRDDDSRSGVSTKPPSPAYSPHSTSCQDPPYSLSFSPDSPTPVRSMKATRQMQKHRQLPYSRPSVAQRASRRVISLPETDPPYSTKTILEATTLRLTSMPERPKPENLLGDSSVSAEHTYLSGSNEDNSRICVGLPIFDVPHTPSPPSSPDSVLIIENSVHLPESFLRNKPQKNVQPMYANDEGWISWASSPPRPIPALHGPLSLPYARCPSGAEGTIIEESNDLSRMIWGLGDDDAPFTRSRTSSYNPHPGNSYKQPAYSQSSVPPRLQQSQTQSAHATNTHGQEIQPTGRSRPLPPTEFDREIQAASHQRVLQALGSRSFDMYTNPEVFKNTVRAGEPKAHSASRPLYDLDNQLQDRLVEDLRALNMDAGLFLDWQSVLAQQTLRNSVLDSGLGTNVIDLLKPSAPAFVPASQSPQPPYPRIFVEPRLPQMSQSIQQPRRMSAIDIAHQYRQQRQLQAILPTPPNSSSPQWSYNFSPYQEPLASSSSHQFKASPPVAHNQQHSPHGDSFKHPASNRTRNQPLDVKDAATPLWSPAQASHSAQLLRAIDEFREVSISQTGYPQNYGILSTPPSARLVQPGPPPNTPLPPVPTAASPSIRYGFEATMTTTPPSPTSPETRTRSLSYQQPRSIPLARLIQRRLSSVPEEDLNAYMERKPSHSPSPSHLKPSPSRSLRTNQNSVEITSPSPRQHQLPSPSTPQHGRTPSPIPVSMLPQSKAGELITEPNSKKGPQVRLPSIPSKRGFPVLQDGSERMKISKDEVNPVGGKAGAVITTPKKKNRGRKPRVPPVVGQRSHTPMAKNDELEGK